MSEQSDEAKTALRRLIDEHEQDVQKINASVDLHGQDAVTDRLIFEAMTRIKEMTDALNTPDEIIYEKTVALITRHAQERTATAKWITDKV